jgi:hypothetical protein
LNLTGVNFTGVASRQEIGKYYDRADIFINASWLDNMPLSIIEAFARALPSSPPRRSACPIWSSTSAPDCSRPVATKRPSPQMSSVCCAIRTSPPASAAVAAAGRPELPSSLPESPLPGFGGQHQRRDRAGIGESGAHYLGRIEHAGLDQSSYSPVRAL